MFAKAIEYDRRGTNPQVRLYYALTKMSGRTTNNIQEVSADLKQYVEMYQKTHGGALPPHMDIVYGYLQEAGDNNWNVTPVINVRNVSSSTSPTPTSTTPTTTTPTTTKPRKP